MTVSIWFDRKVSRCFFAKWREKLPDGKIKYHTQKLVAYSDKYRSKRDVETSPEYLAIVQQIANSDLDSNHWKLLMAVAKVRGKDKPDQLDRALVQRVATDDAAESMMLSTFVETKYWPHAEANLRGKTVREYKSIWTRYSIADKVAGLRVMDFRTKHGVEILESIAADHDVCKSTLQHVKFFLSAVFVLAMNKGYCQSNPMQGVMLPNVRGKHETQAYALDEVLGMLRLPFDAFTKAAIGVGAYAGLRESEIAGLQWADYDGSEITVRRSIDRVKGVANPPKTLKSGGAVPVIPCLKKVAGCTQGNRRTRT